MVQLPGGLQRPVFGFFGHPGCLFTTRETIVSPTPAKAAMCFIVGRRRPVQLHAWPDNVVILMRSFFSFFLTSACELRYT